MLTVSLLFDAAALSCAFICLGSWLKRRKRLAIQNCPYPPGPRGLPLVGNIFDMPGSNEWEKARQWAEEYGELVFVENFGTPYLFVNSYEAAFDLFEKRGNIYSTRPKNVMLELEEWTWMTVAMPYGDELRRSRQYLHRFFQKTSVPDYHEVQTQGTYKLLLAILDDPSEYASHIRHSAGEMIMKVVYGYQIKEKNDPYIALAEKGVDALTEAQTFFLVNAFPILQYLPKWFPGTQFLTIAHMGREYSRAMFSKPFELAKRLMAAGDGYPSMTSKLLESSTDSKGNVSNETLIAKTVGVTYAAGADTTVSALLTFMLAMVLNPEVVRRGQEELDRVIGRDTLPTLNDRPNLPYINAIVSEVLRYEPVAPLGVAHCASEDDVYKGFFIPAGTTILGNIWSITRDPNEYSEPNKFKPERWLPTEGSKVPLDPMKVAFGFGRRICPGRYFAESSVFIGVASILAAFDIQLAFDDDGSPLVPSEEYTTNFVRHPKPFQCKISPRSAKIAGVIRQAVELSN